MKHRLKGRCTINSFCMYCTGNRKKWIKECEDKNCSSHRIRRADITHEEDEIITKKLRGEVDELSRL